MPMQRGLVCSMQQLRYDRVVSGACRDVIHPGVYEGQTCGAEHNEERHNGRDNSRDSGTKKHHDVCTAQRLWNLNSPRPCLPGSDAWITDSSSADKRQAPRRARTTIAQPCSGKPFTALSTAFFWPSTASPTRSGLSTFSARKTSRFAASCPSKTSHSRLEHDCSFRNAHDRRRAAISLERLCIYAGRPPASSGKRGGTSGRDGSGPQIRLPPRPAGARPVASNLRAARRRRRRRTRYACGDAPNARWKRRVS